MWRSDRATAEAVSGEGKLDRTDLAEDRTLLANERTFAGWIRTGLAAVAVGLGFHALFGAVEPAWVAKGIATAFILTGIFIFCAAQRRACDIHRRLHAHRVKTAADHTLVIVAAVLSLASLALDAALWLLV